MSILDRNHRNAFCAHTHVALPPTGRGLLDGLTFGLKDIFDVAGHRTGFGNPDWLRTHEPATSSASVLSRLLEAGASLTGKTHTEEMAFSLTGENAHYGTPVNPAAPGRVPGGSSSGSAVAVASGLVDFAIGSDTGGSVRAPASFCGTYGIRPTHGRIALDGVAPLAPVFDTCGWFARDASLLARVGEVLLGEVVREHTGPIRVLLAVDAFAQALPEAAAALRPAVHGVTRALGPATPVTVSPEGLTTWFEVFRMLQYADIWASHAEWIARTQPMFGPQVGTRFAAVASGAPYDLTDVRAQRREIMTHLDQLLDGDTVLIMPTVPDIAPLLNLPPHETIAVRERTLALLCIAGLGGLPQLTMPLASLDGCPLGLSLVAGRGKDSLLLSLARRISASSER